ncbi:MAG TPA: hypothetical protein V6C58_03375 [Allocoleopsis sp.]
MLITTRLQKNKPKRMQTLRHNTETILDENGIELLVGYDYEVSESQWEECHGYHDVGKMIYTELTSVEVIIKGRGIDILPFLDDRQREFIIHSLNYE